MIGHLYEYLICIFSFGLVYAQIGRSYVISKLKKYPKFQAIAIAIQRSGFKVYDMINQPFK